MFGKKCSEQDDLPVIVLQMDDAMLAFRMLQNLDPDKFNSVKAKSLIYRSMAFAQEGYDSVYFRIVE